MCGISGYLAATSVADHHERVRAMNRALTRRGPDDEGYFDAEGVALAMRRLAIIDVSGGSQPIFNEDRSVIVVMNGEIYNFRSLTEKLLALGHRFATRSDTEVIVHLYEEFGDELVSHLEGMFAFALWDVKRRRLLIARDRLGIKPLYYEWRDARLVFGSEMKALLRFDSCPRDIDAVAVAEFLDYQFIPAPRSIYSSIRKLPPGCTLVAEPGSPPRIEKYWSLDGITSADGDPTALEARAEQLLLEAVESHMVSDVPVGAFLSGGIDSGVIVAMMARCSTRPITTFTVGFRNAGRGFLDERIYARELAERYGFDHNEIEITPDFGEILGDVVTAFDEPFADDSVVPSHYLSQVVGARLKVAMTGLGGDELFAGYRRHLGVLIGQRLNVVPEFLRRGLVLPIAAAVPSRLLAPDRLDHVRRLLGASGDAAEQYESFMSTRASVTLLKLPGAIPSRRVMAAYLSRPKLNPLERALRSDLDLYLPDDILTLTDRISMWHSLELRVPFLDRKLVEFAATLPAEFKIRGRTQKWLLRRIAARWLPSSMLEHRKQGFEAPMGEWLRGPLLPLFDSVVNERSVRTFGMLDWDRLRQLRAEHVDGRHKHSKVLFSALMLHGWAAARIA